MRTNQIQVGIFNLLCLVSDLAAVLGAVLLIWSLQSEAIPLWGYLDPGTQQFIAFFTPTALISIALAGAYRNGLRTSLGRQIVYLIKGTVLCSVITTLWLSLTKTQFPLGSPVSFIGFVLLSLILIRYVLDLLRERLLVRGWGKAPALVAGTCEDARILAGRIAGSTWLPYRFEGYVVWDDEQEIPTDGVVYKTTEPAWQALVQRRRSLVLILPMTDAPPEKGLADLITFCREASITVKQVVSPSYLKQREAALSDLLGVPVVLKERGLRRVNEKLKRAMDIGLSLVGILILTPVLVGIALAIKLDSPGPVFYRQNRLTKNGKPFRIVKFRSMVQNADRLQSQLTELNEADGPLFKIRKDPRITSVGAWLRRSSLDELPQLFNVLIGDLSLVGPRPPTPDEVTRYLPWQKKRLEVIQGMTGLWQISGRSELTFEEMALLDLYYIEHWSLWFDLELLIETVPTILGRKGAY